MSHIAEVYAKDLGVKIGKPVITDHYYPNILDKYIYFNPHGDYPSQEYLYWDIVFSIIKEPLQKEGIEIFTAPKSGNISIKQNNHLIKKSLLYVGTSSHLVQISDIFHIPSVCVLGNMFENNFNLFKHSKVITPDFSDIKPSFSLQEAQNRVNEINPELIAQMILSQLQIDHNINFKTIKIGKNFANQIVEIVPNFFQPNKELKGNPINLRSDIHFDLQNIFYWCQHSIINLHLNKVLEESIISKVPNLKQVIFKYNKEEHEKTDLTNFFKILKKYKKNILIQVSDEEILSDLRLKYFDFNVIFDENPSIESLEIPKNCKFFSKKKFITQGNVFNAEFCAKRLDNSENFSYDEVSKLEIESLYLYVEE